MQPTDFPTPRDGTRSPLARALFAVPGVSAVFLGPDFVTVRKADASDWATLKPEVFAAVMDFYASGQPAVLEGDSLATDGAAVQPGDSDLVASIKELLVTRIRPAVAEDGGDIVYRGFDEATGVVKVKLLGSCSGCPSSSITLKSGIENMLRHYVPEARRGRERERERWERWKRGVALTRPQSQVTAVEEDAPDELDTVSTSALNELEAKLST